MERYLNAPLKQEDIKSLKAGDYVYISGTIYTARDAAHKRMYEAMLSGNEIPMNLQDNIIYYMGPSPAREGHPIGSAGPTTSSRMDKYAPLLMEHGLKGMIGKGKRSPEVINAIIKNGAVYFAAVAALVLCGIFALALQGCERMFWFRCAGGASLFFNMGGALLFVMGRQPYAATFLLVFLAVKVLTLLKRQ